MGIQKEQVVAAALDLLNEQGLEGVTMRKLAQVLEIQAPSLYWHYANKQVLVDAMADALLADVARGAPADGDWAARLIATAGEMRQALLARRDGARVFAGTHVVSDNVLRVGDAMIGAVRAAGGEPELAAWAAFSVLYYVLGFVMEEQSGPGMPGVQEDRAGHRAAFLALACERYPHAHAAADALYDGSTERRFQFGLQLLVDGIRVRIGPPSA